MDLGDSEQQTRRLEDLMARLQRVMYKESVQKSTGMTTSQIFILRYLDKHQQRKASDIAKVAGLSPGAVTQVCDELVRLGLVDRARSTEDRRVVHVRITDAGRSRLEGIRRRRAEQTQRILQLLGPRDSEEFMRIIGRVVEMVETETMEGRNKGREQE